MLRTAKVDHECGRRAVDVLDGDGVAKRDIAVNNTMLTYVEQLLEHLLDVVAIRKRLAKMPSSTFSPQPVITFFVYK